MQFKLSNSLNNEERYDITHDTELWVQANFSTCSEYCSVLVPKVP